MSKEKILSAVVIMKYMGMKEEYIVYERKGTHEEKKKKKSAEDM